MMNKKFLNLVLIAILLLAPSFVLAQEVKFAQLTDVHYSKNAKNSSGRMLKDSGWLLKDAVKQINAIKGLDFVIFTGDNINTPDKTLPKGFGAIANTLKYPWYWTTGNHGVSIGLNREDYLGLMNQINANKHDKTYYSFIVGDFIFICMDGTIEKKPTAHARFSQEELDWLDEQLSSHTDKYAVIFQHFPVVQPFQSSSHEVLNANQYLDVIDRHKNVVAVMSGHYHAAKITERNGVLHVSSPSLVQYPNAFRLITIEEVPDGLKFTFKFMPTTLKNINQESKLNTKSATLNYGNENDRNATIILHTR